MQPYWCDYTKRKYRTAGVIQSEGVSCWDSDQTKNCRKVLLMKSMKGLSGQVPFARVKSLLNGRERKMIIERDGKENTWKKKPPTVNENAPQKLRSSPVMAFLLFMPAPIYWMDETTETGEREREHGQTTKEKRKWKMHAWGATKRAYQGACRAHSKKQKGAGMDA